MCYIYSHSVLGRRLVNSTPAIGGEGGTKPRTENSILRSVSAAAYYENSLRLLSVIYMLHVRSQYVLYRDIMTHEERRLFFSL